MDENTEKQISDELSKSIFKEWLEKLQQESWQLELIISGFALFGIYSSKGALVDLRLYEENVSNDMFVEPLLYLVQIGWKIFFINLLLHVILRSLWIGAIGLRYVSADIDYKALNYSEYFTNFLKRKVGDYDDFIERLEKICSVLFSYTFLLFLLFLSAIAFIMGIALPIIIFEWVGIKENESNMIYAMWWIFPYLFLGIIVFIDFITLGVIKRIKDNTVSKIYLPIYRFFSLITLSFLYRPLLYNFIDDKYTRKLFYFSLPYIFFITFGETMFAENTYPFIPSDQQTFEEGQYLDYKYYDDLYLERNEYLTWEEQKDYKQTASIRLSSYRMNNKFESIFIKHRSMDSKILQKKYGLTPIYDPGWHFTLFNKAKLNEDLKLDIIKKEFEKKYQLLDKQYRGVRDSLRRKQYQGEELISIKTREKQNLQNAKSNVFKDKTNKIAVYKQEQSDMVLNALKELVEIRIDGIDYKDSLTCFYTKHPNNGEKGLICNFNIESLKKGNHILELDRDYDYDIDQDSVLTSKFKLPFIKQF